MQHVQKETRQKPRVSAGFVAGAEGLEPSARGFGVDVGEHSGEQEKAGVTQFSPQVTKRVVLVWCYAEKSGSRERRETQKNALGSFLIILFLAKP